MTRPRPDMEAMHALSNRVDKLIAEGKWDEQAWNDALDEAAEYANGAVGVRDWILSEALESTWLEWRMKASRSS